MAPGNDLPASPAAPGVPDLRPGIPMGPAIPPLNVSGLVVRKADLVAALRIYVPQLGDLVALDNDRFLLSLAPTTALQAENGRS